MHSQINAFALPLPLLLALAASPVLAAQVPPSANPAAHSATTRWCRDNATYGDLTAVLSEPFGKISPEGAPVELTIFSIEKYNPPSGSESLSNDEFCSFHSSIARVQVSITGEVRHFGMQSGRFGGGDMGGGQLDTGDLMLLRSLMDKLPDDQRRVPQPSHRIIVSVVQNGAVTVRVYDRAHLPDEIMEMIRTTGARITFPARMFAPAHSSSFKEAVLSGIVPREILANWTGLLGMLALSPDGSIFVTQDHDDENLHIYSAAGDVNDPNSFQIVHEVPKNLKGGPPMYPVHAHFSPDGGLLLVGFDRPAVRLFSTSTWEQITDPALIPRGTTDYFPSEDWKIGVVQMGSERAFLWDSVKHCEVASLKLNGPLSWAVFSPDDQVVAVATRSAEDQPLQFSRFNTKTGQELPELWPPAWHSRIGRPFQWWGNGRFLVAGFSPENAIGGLGLWDASTGSLLGTFEGCVTSDCRLVLQGSQMLGFCSIRPELPGGVTEWTLDAVLGKIVQWKDDQTGNTRPNENTER